MKDEKLKFLEELNYSYGKLQNSYLKLLENGNTTEAEALEPMILQLSALIEDVQNDAIEEWLSKSTKIESKSKEILSSLREKADEIESNLKTASSVIKGISSIEKAIKQITKLLT